jgi:hypothetical protein
LPVFAVDVSVCCPAAMLSAAPSAPSTTILPSTPPAGPSSLGRPNSS